MSWYYFQPKPSVGELRAKARAAREQLQRMGQQLAPVEVEGRKIAQTFWGQAWCENLEAYRDFEYRLPRGRSYVRNGSVIDLQIASGQIKALVQGSSLYNVSVDIAPLPAPAWAALKQRCAGQIASLLELLRGEFSQHVLNQLVDLEQGLFPQPAEIRMQCSCPDWAVMCKHVAAAMYGVGHRLDAQPELFFTLRQLDPAELIAQAASAEALTANATRAPTIAVDQLSQVFGIDLAPAAPSVITAPPTAGANPSSTSATVPQQPSAPAKVTATQAARTRISNPKSAKPKPKPKQSKAQANKTKARAQATAKTPQTRRKAGKVAAVTKPRTRAKSKSTSSRPPAQ